MQQFHERLFFFGYNIINVLAIIYQMMDNRLYIYDIECMADPYSVWDKILKVKTVKLP